MRINQWLVGSVAIGLTLSCASIGAAVRMRDYWFYLDDADVASKRTFVMVQIMLSLTDSSETARGPVVSITN